jgi:hypothetical protein
LGEENRVDYLLFFPDDFFPDNDFMSWPSKRPFWVVEVL